MAGSISGTAVRQGMSRIFLAQGQGLNSIPVRFALLAAICSSLCTVAQLRLVLPLLGESQPALVVALLALTIAVPAGVTYLAARKLTGTILALRRSTEAIAAGDFNRPVEVDCACEVGGLADGFRAMIKRLNNNILRMNILAYTDPVTHLPNRAVLDHVLGLLSQQGQGPDCRGALLFIDLDGFKRVNDTLGHEAGDQLLREASARLIQDGLGIDRGLIDDCTTAFGELRDACPERPVFARFAGDEFVVLLPGIDDEERLSAITQCMVAALARPFRIAGAELRVTASIGVARLPSDTTSPDQLLNHADIAMYAAKEAGKNRVRFFDASLRTETLDRARIETELRRAIDSDELELHFQPKFDCRSLSIAGVEALVRWRHPTEGMIMPARFIAAAEQSGQMAALGSCVLRLAVRQLRAWQDRGIGLKLAVNVSAAQLEHGCFVQEVLGLLAAQGADPARLELEVTESMVMSGIEAVRGRLKELQAAGLRISIDDFGTGYSNLSQLASLPSDSLKLDRSLVEGLGANAKAEGIVAATIGMAHALGHRVVAEGLETPRQLAFLRHAGCDEVQGFMLARPMPAQALEAWLESWEAEAAPRAA